MIFVNSMSDLFHDDVPTDIIKRIFDTMNRAPIHTFQVLTKRAERLAQLAPDLQWGSNIWMGVSIENQDTIFRADYLKQTDAHVKFISAEPLLSPLPNLDLQGIDWLIVGGESGPGSRPMLEAWVMELKSKCEESGTAFFFKQWGGPTRNGLDRF